MKRFSKILYVSEPSVEQTGSIAQVIALCRSNQADLTLIEVIPPPTPGMVMPPGGPSADDLAVTRISNARKALISLLGPDADHDVDIDVRVGTKFMEVIRAVLEDGYDLVIKPAENPDWIERLFGSDDMHLLRKCPCPVWLMKPQKKTVYETVVAAIDFDPNEVDIDRDEQALNDQILEFASALALAESAELHLVHVWDAPEAGFISMWTDDPAKAEVSLVEGERARHEAGMDSRIQMLRSCLGEETYDYISPRVHVLMGSPRKAIPSLVSDLGADVLVMGTVARTGIPGLFIGNTSEAILDQLKCSVLAVKPAGFVTPIKPE
ncbi:universal stress protein [Marinobacter nanhaiticus D15-8W]|uniref:Universal stress protein n=1 Tax=Marinobacter nanhaiticus D15-8W TaxID=626887 RepID=N6VXF2_9GAMM|nr:universal stress protein [Marinobacter nanhaiticus]ENO14940.1 universal stress protein [Marinobacter nanhaiticus D15-8W]BES69364.1 universal stress protein [Marinobacter nanhaiticus D15-8W]